MDTQTILVTGSTGKTGRRIVERLRALGRPVRSGSRSARPSFDWEDRGTWRDALDGVSAAYICYYPDIAGARRRQNDPGVRRARRRLRCPPSRAALGPRRARSAALRARSCARPAWSRRCCAPAGSPRTSARTSCSSPCSAVRSRFRWVTLVSPSSTRKTSRTSLSQRSRNRDTRGSCTELTGPRLLTFAEAVAEIGRASGRVVRYVRIPVEDYAASLRGAQVPDEVVEALTYLFAEVLDGRNASVADGVQRALGRAPGDFTAYAEATAATGTWDAVPTPAMR